MTESTPISNPDAAAVEAHLDYAAELKHLIDNYDALMLSYQESDEHKRVTLDEIGFKVERTKQRYFAMQQENVVDTPAGDPQLEEFLDDLRDSFKRLERKSSTGGPPLS
jgi:hypothetical protein